MVNPLFVDEYGSLTTLMIWATAKHYTVDGAPGSGDTLGINEAGSMMVLRGGGTDLPKLAGQSCRFCRRPENSDCGRMDRDNHNRSRQPVDFGKPERAGRITRLTSAPRSSGRASVAEMVYDHPPVAGDRR